MRPSVTYTGIETAEFQEAEEFLIEGPIGAATRGALPRFRLRQAYGATSSEADRGRHPRSATQSPHEDRSELPRLKTMTNAWPKADEISSARPRRLKMIVANMFWAARGRVRNLLCYAISLRINTAGNVISRSNWISIGPTVLKPAA